ncbi:ATP-binding cassette domain-containing protein [Simplicispira hankyongi]|jgi:tungstate transport system ATP-binding protein|uniref:ATP-binding cassette domain-containing protein n=1 Tax=Simplicispira hankyongi TaxID=2315688 RepID=A0A398C510_9BURK|nr:ATP-binding cassette domain-containing protein [Simplicispira hankyongi]RID98032.1 ATP-binding cassette domain-containing protein [Simplicispira hankyongi]
MPNPAPLLALRSAGVRFGALHALQEVNLSVHVGERLALIGANGSGKSTLLRVLHGLQRLSSGEMVHGAPHRQAMLFQRPHLLRASTQTNVALALWLRGHAWRDARAQALRALARVGLEALARQNGRTLSGGQQQRVALARVWALQAQVLLLDEPTSSLDPHAKREVEALIAQLAGSASADAQAGPVTTVFSSHNLGQVKRLATRVLYLEQGRVLADLPVHDFFNGPLPEAARLFVKGDTL